MRDIWYFCNKNKPDFNLAKMRRFCEKVHCIHLKEKPRGRRYKVRLATHQRLTTPASLLYSIPDDHFVLRLERLIYQMEGLLCETSPNQNIPAINANATT
jgi:hypothetical protein